MLVTLNGAFFGSRPNRVIELTTRWSRTESTPSGKAGSEMNAADCGSDRQVLLDGRLRRGAVGVRDLLSLGQCRVNAFSVLGYFFAQSDGDRVALDREVLGRALVQVGEFLEAVLRLAEADERLGGERRD